MIYRTGGEHTSNTLKYNNTNLLENKKISTYNFYEGTTMRTSSSHQNLTCSRHDIDPFRNLRIQIVLCFILDYV
jgi:hypothetical protein